MSNGVEDLDEMPEEVDFSNAARGRFAGRFAEGVTVVMLEPDVARAFPSAEAVNSALRSLMHRAEESDGQVAKAS